MTKQELKLKKKIESELRNKEFAKNKDYYESLIGIIVTWTPLFVEYYEELNVLQLCETAKHSVRFKPICIGVVICRFKFIKNYVSVK